jgi:hypothetical protein
MEGRATLEEIDRVFDGLAASLGPDDRVLVVLIGHGSFDEREARFNLPGPDITPGMLEDRLQALGERPVAIVNCAPSSGAFVAPLAGPGRVVISATRSGRERNETVFGTYFVSAWSGEEADLDKDGRTSLLEAFTYARRATADHYERGEHMLTEHALLEDDGDGEGSGEPDPTSGDGALARTFYLAPAALSVEETARAAADPELARLYRERAAGQQRVEELRARKAGMAEDVYMRELERLLLDLARINREIAARGGRR